MSEPNSESSATHLGVSDSSRTGIERHPEVKAPGPTDSAGTPWAGRKLADHPYAGDTGEIDPQLQDVLTRFASATADMADVVEVLRQVRILAPILAELEESGEGEHGLQVDKAASAGIVALGLPDGRSALPVFSSMDQMLRWNSEARPIPTDLARAALSVVAEDWQTIVLDPAGDALVLPRPAVWAVAQDEVWVPAVRDGKVDAQLAEHIQQLLRHPVMHSVNVIAGEQAEVVVQLVLPPGLDRGQLDQLLAWTQQALASSEMVGHRVDSLQLSLQQAP